MMRTMRRFLFFIPSAVMWLLATALWLGTAHTQAGMVGWTLLFFVLTTATGIDAAVRGCRPAAACEKPYWAWVLAMSLLMPATLAFVLLAPVVGVWSSVRVGVLLMTWTGLWMSVAWALARFGTGVSFAVPLALAGVCFASPLLGMPVVRSAAHWGVAPGAGVSVWQARVVAAEVRACPFFGAMEALRPQARVDWGTLPGMYEWSGLGQEVPVEMPGSWGCAGVYGLVALGVAGVKFRTQKKCSESG